MSRFRTVLRNVCSNWVGFAVQAAVVFFLTPFTLTQLGDARYGIWVLIISVTGYYGLLAFGLRGGVTQYLTRYLATRDFDKMNSSASTAVAVLASVGFAVLLASLTLAWLATTLFEIPASAEKEVFWCVLIVGAATSLQLALFPFSAAFVATQRYDLSNLIGITTRLLSAALIYVALKNEFGLIGVCVAVSVTDSMGYIARWAVAYRIIPQLKISRTAISSARFREMFSFGGWAFVASIAHSVFLQADALVIGMFMPFAAIATYALAANLRQQIESLLSPIVRVFFPVATEMHARGETDALRQLHLQGSRLFLNILVIVAVMSGVWANDFFRLWVGEQYTDGIGLPSVSLLFHILLVALVAGRFPGLGDQVLMGALRMKPIAILAAAEAALNIVLSIALIQVVGLVGVAIGTATSVLIFRTIAVPICVTHVTKVTISEYMRFAAFRPLLLAGALLVAAMLIRQSIESTNFFKLAWQGAVFTVVAAPLVFFIGLNNGERSRFVYVPLATRCKRLGHSNSRNSFTHDAPP